MHHILPPTRDLPLAYSLLGGTAEAYGKGKSSDLSKLKYSAGVIAFNWCAGGGVIMVNWSCFGCMHHVPSCLMCPAASWIQVHHNQPPSTPAS